MKYSTTSMSTRLLWAMLAFFPLLAQASVLPPGFAEVRIADELDPVAMAMAPDGRLFLAEKFGRILIVENGLLRPDPFTEIEVDNFNERGLSGITIDPDFENNHYIYVYYTVPGANHNRVSRITADGYFAAPGSETVLIDLDTLTGPHHNAGAMVFGTDGMLYIAVGDGTNQGNAQNMNTVLGKILRIRPDGSIPEDNPFFNELEGKNRAIWASGVRNPFAMTVQPGTGRIFTTEVGGYDFEEINEILMGRNYGWPDIEGMLAQQIPPANYKDPVYAYPRTDGCAAVGITIYNPAVQLFPDEYLGKIFYSDYCGGNISLLDPETGERSVFASSINRPLNMVVGPDGTLYYLSRAGLGGGSAEDNTSTSQGSLWRVFYTGSNAPFIAVQPKTKLIPETENATFRVVASGTHPLVFQWQKNSVDLPAGTAADLLLENVSLSDSGSVFRCIVTNTEGADTSKAATLKVTASQRPEPDILTPVEGASYRAGDLLLFTGEALDPDEGQLPASALQWKIDFYHDEHSHPAYGPVSGVESDSFLIPKNEEVDHEVWLRISLTAEDASGLSKTVTQDLFPEKTWFMVQTSPAGFPVNVNGQILATPDTVRSVIGVYHGVGAPISYVFNDSLYLFKKWSNGKTTPAITVEATQQPLILKAIYRAVRRLDDGTGLTGQYFDDLNENLDFDENVKFSRIDTTVNFEWAQGSPDSVLLGNNFFMVRWEGAVQPYFDDLYNFHVISGDGARLWVNDSLLIDQWYYKHVEEATGSVFLKGGQKYPIKLEYFEAWERAACFLLWSNNRLARHLIPKSQLFPESVLPDTATLFAGTVKVYPNPVSSLLNIETVSQTEAMLHYEVFNTYGQQVAKGLLPVDRGFTSSHLDWQGYPSGVYFFKISGQSISEMIKISKL